MTDTEIVQAIHALLDSQQWDSDTLDRIADVLERSGYKIHDYEPTDDDYERSAEDAQRKADAREGFSDE